jgi:ribosomal protein L21
MPVHTGKDAKGCFAQWGGRGKKYRYPCGNASARKRAKAKAAAQGRAAHASGYVGNKEKSTMSKSKFEFVTFGLKEPLVRQDTMEGRDWTVVPTQMITEGVHNGSDGPIYYPAEELAKLPSAWNHMPVVVYHPTVNGTSVTARTPDQITSRKVGVLMNTKWDDSTKKLGAETWLDPSRMSVVDSRIGEAIENKEMMEVSTGLYMELDESPGEWNGEKYNSIAHNLQPDHLALLPDVKGACSIEDGAGFLRSNQEFRKLIVNEISHQETRNLLSGALRASDDNAWIEEVYDDYIIYETGGKLYKQEYTIDGGIVSFVGLSKLVERQVTFKEVVVLEKNDDKKILKGNSMDKQKIVDALIANERLSWTEEHREQLMAMDEDILTNMASDIEELSKPVENKEDDKQDAQDDKKVPVENKEVTTNAKPSKPETMEEFIAKAPPEIRESLTMSVNTMNAEKARLIEVIKTNEQNTFTDEHLKGMDIQMLQALARIAGPVPTDNDESGRTVPLYIGQGDPASVKNSTTEEPLLLPVMDFGEGKQAG